MTRHEIASALQEGIEGGQLYDAWGGKGFWTPVVKMHERDALILARWIADREDRLRRQIAADIRAAKPAPNSALTWQSGRNKAARIASGTP